MLYEQTEKHRKDLQSNTAWQQQPFWFFRSYLYAHCIQISSFVSFVLNFVNVNKITKHFYLSNRADELNLLCPWSLLHLYIICPGRGV